jgi:ribosomal protein L37AE/L43A
MKLTDSERSALAAAGLADKPGAYPCPACGHLHVQEFRDGSLVCEHCGHIVFRGDALKKPAPG